MDARAGREERPLARHQSPAASPHIVLLSVIPLSWLHPSPFPQALWQQRSLPLVQINALLSSSRALVGDSELFHHVMQKRRPTPKTLPNSFFFLTPSRIRQTRPQKKKNVRARQTAKEECKCSVQTHTLKKKTLSGVCLGGRSSSGLAGRGGGA
jgi:hypothetical protein